MLKTQPAGTTEIKEELYSLAEEEYRNFNQKLLPGVPNILGVRLPALRKMAKRIAKEDGLGYLQKNQDLGIKTALYEEIMLYGLVLGYTRMDTRERMIYLKKFIPKIQNWGVCDSSCGGYKFMEEDKETWFPFVKSYAKSDKEYEIRFALVSMLGHFIDEEHIDEILSVCDSIHHEGYYAKMAVAWAVSMCYVNFPEKTERFLQNNHMDAFTHNKSIQKIRESYRVTKEEKERLKLLKRKER